MTNFNNQQQYQQALDRRQFFGSAAGGIGVAALASLLSSNPSTLRGSEKSASAGAGLPGLPHFAPKAKSVIFLHQSGAPSQLDLFDYKPKMEELHGQELPESIRMGQRLTSMTADQKTKPLTASPFKFSQHGQCGAELSELLPHTAKVVDQLCFIRSLHTQAINHDPGITFMQTGSELPGRPSMGAWLSYGLGSENENLPAFMVFISGGMAGDQPLFGRLWGAGFLPSNNQGVKLRGSGDPILYLNNPAGISRTMRRRMIDGLAELNKLQYETFADPEINARIAQYEMAFRMQASVPELVDISDESQQTFELYGEEAKKPGSYAANCLLARRMVERGVRFVQLYHRGWDHHSSIVSRIREKCRQTDQPSAALVHDLQQRGLLDETLVVWAGEFGRTVYSQGDQNLEKYGRDHHPRCFTIWMAGGGIKGGITYGKTDDFSYNIAENQVDVHDLQATILHLLGIDHKRLTYRSQSRDYRLTDIAGRVVSDIMA